MPTIVERDSTGAMDLARSLVRGAGRIVALTGAGVSAESGVPTFRGAGGLWKQFRAEDLATPDAFAKAANDAKAGCPISRLLNAKISMEARLV